MRNIHTIIHQDKKWSHSVVHQQGFQTKSDSVNPKSRKLVKYQVKNNKNILKEAMVTQDPKYNKSLHKNINKNKNIQGYTSKQTNANI